MEEVTWGLLILLTCLPVLKANNIDKNSPFYYDWENLQLGGLICAGIMCIAGIIFALSNKCKCKSDPNNNPLPEKATPLINSGCESHC
ncbi:FXYD domain-containing ion transport regulator 4-like isoform X1 [Echinops telfairi]|uniref:FXYD domain-containing ion transport regulator 4-like isoform X1 n=1 Tax=Echinops telfairi TaxID=9371 RepID=A0AC55CMC4_ECHTE|nr:FXYD domain-containing ion transport regulator 4-like isoform X1 [Echinops telfairi]